MDELKPHEAIKLNDFRAHLHSLQVELGVVKGELEVVLGNKDDAVRAYNAVNEDLAAAQAELVVAKERCAQVDARYRERLDGELKLANDKQEFSVYQSAELARLESQKSAMHGKLFRMQDEVNILLRRKSELEAAIPPLEERVEFLIARVNGLVSEFDSIERNIANRKTSAEQELATLKKQIAQETKNLADLVAKNHEEGKKLEGPTQGLKEREDRVARRERSFETIKARLAKQFTKMYPGQTLNI